MKSNTLARILIFIVFVTVGALSAGSPAQAAAKELNVLT